MNSGCSFGEFCDKPDGDCGGEGICKASPVVCTGACTGVCGCDGSYYCNACVALKSGVDVDLTAICEPPPPVVAAMTLAEGRLWLFKLDWERDVCTRIVLAPEGAGGEWAAEVTAPWTIESIMATDHALDCLLPFNGVPVVPIGESVEPTQASGSIELDEPEIPCGISADLLLSFAPTEWIGAEESLELPYMTLVLCD